MSRSRIAILVVLVLALCCVVGALGVLAYRIFVPTVQAEEGGPTILIESPGQGDEVIIGETVDVFATGHDPARITHMELWVDGSHIATQHSALPDGTNPFPFIGEWVPTTPGNHSIVVRGYNTADVSGQATVSVNAVEGPDFPTEMPPEGCADVPIQVHEVLPGETLEGIAGGYGVTVEEILACNPGLDPSVPLTPGDTLNIPDIPSPEDEAPPPPGEEPPDAEVPPEAPPEAEDPPGEEAPPGEGDPPPGEDPPPEAEDPPEPPDDIDPPEPEDPTAVLELEAYELEVDQAYDGVYCMVTLADADMEMVPDMDTFDPIVGNFWDIEAELGGANSRMVIVFGETLDLMVECFGFTGALLPVSLGTVERQHPEADWTGDPIEVTSMGGEGGRWFRAVYRICPFPCDPRPIPDAPQNLTYGSLTFGLPCPLPPSFCGAWPDPVTFHFLTWDWLGDETTIDGFRLRRNGGLVYEIDDPSSRHTLITTADANPPCGEAFNYHLTAYEGLLGVGSESAPSNIETLTGPTCPQTVVLTYHNLNTGCILADCPPSPPNCATCDVNKWYGRIFANGERIQVEQPSFMDIMLGWDVPDIDSHHSHSVSGLFGADTLTVNLGEGEDLTLGIWLKDWDFLFPDPIFCAASHGVPSTSVAGLDGGTWVLHCSGTPEGPGSAGLIFSVDVTPSP
jgi:hypothetical protein